MVLRIYSYFTVDLLTMIELGLQHAIELEQVRKKCCACCHFLGENAVCAVYFPNHVEGLCVSAAICACVLTVLYSLLCPFVARNDQMA